MTGTAEQNSDNASLLPSAGKYERTMAAIDAQVLDAGGLHAFLEEYRASKRNSYDHDRFLAHSVDHTFMLLKDPDMPLLDELGMKKARAIATGMLMGHIVNKAIFPLFNSDRVYNTVSIYKEHYSPGVENAELKEELGTQTGRYRVYQAASNLAMARLNDDSGERVRVWATTISGEHRVLAALGVGISLFQGFDYHVEVRKRQVKKTDSENKNSEE